MNDREELAALRRMAELEAKAGNADIKAGRDAPGALRGLLSVAQGPTFGFADEIIGALSAPGKSLVNGQSLGQNYREMRDYARGAAAQESENNPVTSALTRGMAAAPTMLLGGAPKSVGMIPNIFQAGKVGAVTGAAGGLGGSEANSLAGMAGDTAMGAGTGMTLGSLSVPIARTMGHMGQNVLSRFNDPAAVQYAKQKLTEAFSRDARGTVTHNNLTSSLQQPIARLGKLGDEARTVDAGGDNTRQLLDTLATLPGQTKPAVQSAIRSRQSGRADRMIGAAEESMQTNGDRASQVVEELMAKRQAAATPLYGKLHKMEVNADPELAQMLSAAEQLGAGKVAQDISTAARVPYSLAEKEWSASGGKLAMRDLDHMKQGLDTLIAKQTDMAGKVSPLGFRLQGLRADLVAKLDAQTGGAYKAARDAFAGPSALIDATNNGRRFMTADDAATRQVLTGLSESEKEAFRLGAFEALRNKLGRPGGQTEILGMWKDKILREKLQAVFPDERAFRQFSSTASAESAMKGLESVGRGSQTAARQYAAGDLDVPAVTDAVQAFSGTGGIAGMLANATRAYNRVQTPEAVRDNMGRILLQQGPAARNALMDLQETARLVNMSRAKQANALGVGAGMAGGGLSNLLSR